MIDKVALFWQRHKLKFIGLAFVVLFIGLGLRGESTRDRVVNVERTVTVQAKASNPDRFIDNLTDAQRSRLRDKLEVDNLSRSLGRARDRIESLEQRRQITTIIREINRVTTNNGRPGANGTNGSNGADGIQGLQGPKGDKGDTGARGPAGSNGANGGASVSIDINAIVARVLAQLDSTVKSSVCSTLNPIVVKLGLPPVC